MSADQSAGFIEQIRAAGAEQQRLQIKGHGSKAQLLPLTLGDDFLELSSHAGILQYEPEELVLTARAGTALAEIDAVLAERQQMLACEPPQLRRVEVPQSNDDETLSAGTLGGAVACGLSGPSRPWLGAIRDAVLGVELINGAGEYLKFGGQVMKNVAGYDVSRLQAGAWGALGVMAVISLRVQPCFALERTLRAEMSASEALALCAKLGVRNLPITGTAWIAGQLHMRLAGNDSGVDAACAALAEFGLQVNTGDEHLWRLLKNQDHDFFGAAVNRRGTTTKLWRLVTPPAAAMPHFLSDPNSDALVLWAGGLRWIFHDDALAVADYCRQVGGWGWAVGEAMPIDPLQQQIMTHLAKAFDPHGVFANPLKLHATAGEA
ncbi:MAG: glycolate oxidase subunit GlcE [Pseudomonadales bacterium]|nr:glycolate oxidase subunit GlcE [Pseudomonadales bacterium]